MTYLTMSKNPSKILRSRSRRGWGPKSNSIFLV